MKVYLKIKIKSLAAEATMIRREERKQNPGHRARVRARRLLASGKIASNEKEIAEVNAAKRALRPVSEKAKDRFWGLRFHRTEEVRDEARSSHVAYGFLRGLDYKRVENSAKTEPDWTRVEQLVKKYGEDDVRDRMQRFAEWKDAAVAA